MKGSWTCKKCQNVNSVDNRHCVKCGDDFHNQLNNYPNPDLDSRGTPSFSASDLLNTLATPALFLVDLATSATEASVEVGSSVCSVICDIVE